MGETSSCVCRREKSCISPNWQAISVFSVFLIAKIHISRACQPRITQLRCPIHFYWKSTAYVLKIAPLSIQTSPFTAKADKRHKKHAEFRKTSKVLPLSRRFNSFKTFQTSINSQHSQPPLEGSTRLIFLINFKNKIF